MAVHQLSTTRVPWHGFMIETASDGRELFLWRQNLAWRPRWIMGVAGVIGELIGAGTRPVAAVPFESRESRQERALSHLLVHAVLIVVAPVPALVEILLAALAAPAWWLAQRLRGRGPVIHLYEWGRHVETRTDVTPDDLDDLLRSIRDGGYDRVDEDFSDLLVRRPGRTVRRRRR